MRQDLSSLIRSKVEEEEAKEGKNITPINSLLNLLEESWDGHNIDYFYKFSAEGSQGWGWVAFDDLYKWIKSDVSLNFYVT